MCPESNRGPSQLDKFFYTVIRLFGLFLFRTIGEKLERGAALVSVEGRVGIPPYPHVIMPHPLSEECRGEASRVLRPRERTRSCLRLSSDGIDLSEPTIISLRASPYVCSPVETFTHPANK